MTQNDTEGGIDGSPVNGPWDLSVPGSENSLTPDEVILEGTFAGKRWAVLWLALKSGIFTVLTLGLYRFWMKTRLRRWYWSAIRVGGHPLEYVGDPLEKLLGFLIAVVILAFYIGIVNLLLMFASFALFQGNFAAYLLSFVGVIPLWFFARYRARRYVLARTRWRGIRFGLLPGAWGYAWRALVHWLITIGSVGLLWPRMTFYLEKYRTDRTYFGTAHLVQDGKWTMLYRPFLPFVLGAAIIAIGVLAGFLGTATPAVIFVMIGSALAGYGVVHYHVRSIRLLTRHKTVDGVILTADPRPWRVLWIYGVGYSMAGFIALILLIPFTIGALITVERLGFDLVPNMGALETLPQWILTGSSIAMYFAFFLLWAALGHGFVMMPLMRHFAETFVVVDQGGLANIRQRARDEFDEAEGFAEALDVGAGI